MRTPCLETPSPAHQMFLSNNVCTKGPCAQTLLQDSTRPEEEALPTSSSRGGPLCPLESSGSSGRAAASRRICLFRLGAASHTHLRTLKTPDGSHKAQTNPHHDLGSVGACISILKSPRGSLSRQDPDAVMEGEVAGVGKHTEPRPRLTTHAPPRPPGTSQLAKVG